MIRVQTTDGQWFTLPESEARPADLFQRPFLEVVPVVAAFQREWVNTAHVVRAVRVDEARA